MRNDYMTNSCTSLIHCLFKNVERKGEVRKGQVTPQKCTILPGTHLDYHSMVTAQHGKFNCSFHSMCHVKTQPRNLDAEAWYRQLWCTHSNISCAQEKWSLQSMWNDNMILSYCHEDECWPMEVISNNLCISVVSHKIEPLFVVKSMILCKLPLISWCKLN